MGNDEFVLDVGQAHELKLAFKRNGWSNEEIKTLSMGDNLRLVRECILGNAEIKPVEHIINFDVWPDAFHNGIVRAEPGQVGTRLRGKHKLDWTRFRARTVESVMGSVTSKIIKNGDDLALRLDTQGKVVVGAQLLDYLWRRRTHLIPDNWKHKPVAFWGTIFVDRNNFNKYYVKYLFWHEGESKWGWSYASLDSMNPHEMCIVVFE